MPDWYVTALYSCTCSLLADNETCFKRLFIVPSYAKTFWSCPDTHHVVSADGTHAGGGVINQVWLLLVGSNANNQLVLLAFAVVRQEDQDNWTWFMRQATNALKLPPNTTAVLISDMHKGLTSPATQDILKANNWVHTRCTFHFINNLRKRHGMSKVIEKTIMRIARHTNADNVASALATLHGPLREEVESQLGMFSAATLLDKDPPVVRYRHITNNTSEQYNSALKNARPQAITDGVKTMLAWAAKHVGKAKGYAYKWEEAGAQLVPYASRELRKIIDRARTIPVQIIQANQLKAEAIVGSLTHQLNDAYTVTVSLAERTSDCACRWQQESGFACCHTLAVALAVSQTAGCSNADEWRPDHPLWVCSKFHLAAYKQQYAGAVPKIGKILNLEDNGLEPPYVAPRPGRRPIQRKKGQKRKRPAPGGHEEAVRRKPPTCNSCGKTGHYSTTCWHPNTAHMRKKTKKQVDKIVIDLTKP